MKRATTTLLLTLVSTRGYVRSVFSAASAPLR